MKRILVALLAASFAAPAAAHSRLILGFHFGVPIYYPPPVYYAPPPIYYPPPAVIYAPPPASNVQPETFTYYYCPESKSYYPYVRECPGGWERVPGVPPR
jgi:hypothetical protein